MKALILDSNKAIQLQATHCLKQLQLEPVIEQFKGSALELQELVKKYSPKLLIIPNELTDTGFELNSRCLVLSKDTTDGSNQLTAHLAKPFKTEELLKALQDLIHRADVEVMIDLQDPILLTLVKLFLKDQGISHDVTSSEKNSGEILKTKFFLTDSTDVPTHYQLATLVEINSETDNIVGVLTKALGLNKKNIVHPPLPLTPGEKERVKRTIISKIEILLDSSHRLRAREWSGLEKELLGCVSDFFKENK